MSMQPSTALKRGARDIASFLRPEAARFSKKVEKGFAIPSQKFDIVFPNLPRGVTVALQILDLFVMVRIHARQPPA